MRESAIERDTYIVEDGVECLRAVLNKKGAPQSHGGFQCAGESW